MRQYVTFFFLAFAPLYSGSHLSADEACPAPPEWFKPLPTPKPSYAKPDPDSDCDFYKWAWQTFLYVTQPDINGDSRIRLLRFQTPADIFPPSSTPRFQKQAAKLLTLAPRLAKLLDDAGLDEFLQADSNGVLVDSNGRVVYYAQHMNDRFVKFVDDNHFQKVDNIAKAPTDLEFPRGSLELKSSWKILGPGDDKTRFFTTNAVVAVLKLVNGKPTIDPSHTRPETVALVGLHVVGVVDGHPEFVWATFEHNDNAPNLTPGADPNGTQAVDGSRDYTFYPKGTAAKDGNKKQPLKFKSEPDQTFEPSIPIFRLFPFGGEKEQDDAIKSLNKTVYESIDKLAPALSLWKNYSLTGAVWLNNPAYFREGSDFAAEDAKNEADRAKDPTVADLRILGGEKKLLNSTMETFTQAVKVNCFSCHRTTAKSAQGVQFPANRIGVSHILVNAYVHARQTMQAQQQKGK